MVALVSIMTSLEHRADTQVVVRLVPGRHKASQPEQLPTVVAQALQVLTLPSAATPQSIQVPVAAVAARPLAKVDLAAPVLLSFALPRKIFLTQAV